MSTRSYGRPFPNLLETTQKTTLLSVLLFVCLFLNAQTPISGVVNSYYKVIEVIPSKACLRLNTVTGLGYNDIGMIIQMKGATINTSSSTSSTFGDTISLNNVGNYELSTICYIRGDSVFFNYMFLNNYDVAFQVQLVKIPEYFSARVADTLKAAPWNNATGTGGVLAIYVDQDLILNAPISGDTMGYRGGSYRLSNGTCSNIAPATAYAYNPTNATQNGAYKGEGVADVAIAQAGGRGAPANGGGGGNNHNNGGGGGANLNLGGNGGGNSSTSGCMTPIQGLGGKALSRYGGKKIFMGGGGGAGHSNNGFVASNGGGHGGGIVFVRANNLIGNGYTISANGQVGGPALSDGSSGGGAAGTIIVAVNNFSGIDTIEANGGQGGTEDDGLNLNKCYGSGGGGSGGAIYFSGSIPASPVVSTVTAGAAGPEINHDVSCATAVASSPGSTGQIFANYSYRISLVLSNSYCTTLLPVELTYFNAAYANGQVVLTWDAVQPELIDRFIVERSLDGSHWIALDTRYANDGLFEYRYNDLSAAAGANFYRIKVVRKSNVISYSVVKRIMVPGKNEMINIYPNPASRQLFISGLSSVAQLSLFDQTGKLVWERRIISPQSIVEVELPALAKGLYIIKVGETVKRLSIN